MLGMTDLIWYKPDLEKKNIYMTVGWKIHRLKSLYDDVISTVDFFTNGIQVLQRRRKKCLDHKDDYVEK